MLTYELWHETGKSFSELALVGEEVDEEMVDYFINVLPPFSMRPGYVQVGEAHSHREDNNGNWRPTFLTFEKNSSEQWIYRGPCFGGETVCQQ